MKTRIRFSIWLAATLVTAIFLIVGLQSARAQNAGPKFTQWSAPVPITELNNASTSESPNSISKDGLSLYINYVNPTTNTGEDIYVAHRATPDAPWNTPVIVPNVNSTKNDRHAFITPDGHWLYFASNRTGGMNNSYDIYVSWRGQVNDDASWEAPTLVPVINTNGFDVGPRAFEDELGRLQLYFSSNPLANAQPADIFRTILGPQGFEQPVAVAELNSTNHEGACYLRKDGREIYFPRSIGTAQTIFISSRQSTDAVWATPTQVDELVPPGRNITNPVLSWDGLTIYISVYEGTSDIYVSHRQKLRGPKCDFDGDGRTDVSVFRPSEGMWYLNQSQAGFSAIKWGMESDKLIPADYDGDGKADLAVFRPVDAEGVADFHILNSNGFTYTGIAFGLIGDIPMPGDYDADAKADIAVYRPSVNIWWVTESSTGAIIGERFGSPGDIPLIIDNDGDGKDHVAVYRPADHSWYVERARPNPSQTFDVVPWGSDRDILVPADYDGDGKEDIAIFRPSDGTWYIVRSSDGQQVYAQFGADGDVPVPGDYDGDGKTDMAVYRGGTWFINGTTSGFTVDVFGLNTDLPVPAAYNQ